MALHLKCPNGHKLTAKDSQAGKTGKCPVCKCSVKIPVPKNGAITESAVLDILGDPETKQDSLPSASSIFSATQQKSIVFGRPIASGSLPTTKSCPSCERDIDVGYHICPHCKTYLTGADEL